MSEPRFRVLDALGAELDGAIAREQRRRVPCGHGRSCYTLLAYALAGRRHGDGELPADRLPDPWGACARRPGRGRRRCAETARLMGLDAADPAGGRPWDVRVSRSRTGQLCTAVGQVVDGRLGIVGLDGRFRALPQLGYDTCGQAAACWSARACSTRRVARTCAPWSVAWPVRASTASSWTVAASTRTLELGPEGTFITVFAGYPEDVAPVDPLSGERKIALAAVEGPRAADPVQGAWTVDAGERAPSATARARRARRCSASAAATSSPGGMSYPVCGDLREDPFFFEVAALPRAEEVRKPRQTFPWGFATPRTVVWGATRADVERITRSAGKPVELSPSRASWRSSPKARAPRTCAWT